MITITSNMIFPESLPSKAPSWRTTITATATPFSHSSTSLRRPGVVCFRTQNPGKDPGLVLTRTKKSEGSEAESKRGFGAEMLGLCGVGYWVQGFRCFPWLALNFEMAYGLGLSPATLQLLQSSGNLPMAAKPIYGLLSDAFPIAGGRRIPYISIGVILQILSWGPLALTPAAAQSLLTLTAFVLLGNLGASVTEVAKDALVAEYGLKHSITGLQSYALMASAAGGILGNLLGGYFLMKVPPKTMFLSFTLLLSLQLAFALRTREESLGLAGLPDENNVERSVSESFSRQLIELRTAIGDEFINRPLAWIVASIAMVPSLSGLIFCYQMRCLSLDPSVIGMSRVVSQLILLSATVLYNRYWRRVPIRNLVGAIQILYAGSVLLDLVLLKQINLRMGIPNATFALCFSGLAETIAQFKLLPFSVLLASLCPRGCEASLTSFLASSLCLSSIVSGASGIGLSHLLRITSDDYSNLPVAVLVQFFAALLPLLFIENLPASQAGPVTDTKRWLSKRPWRNTAVERAAFGSEFFYRNEREAET